MAEVEFYVTARDGEVEISLFEDNDDFEVLTLSPQDAWMVANKIVEAAQEAEESQ